MNSLLTRLYPFLFLALVVCGPVLLLPAHAAGVYLRGHGGRHRDAGLRCHPPPSATRSTPPFLTGCGRSSQKRLRRSLDSHRLAKITLFFNRAFNLSTALLLILTAHPWFGGLAVLEHLIVSAYLRLMAKIHAANK